MGTVPAFDRAHVVLYTSSPDSRIAAATLHTLRDFAAGQGLAAVQEAYDLAPLDVPRSRRTGWRTVERLLTAGEAAGLVAPAEREIAWHDGDRTALRVWLLGLQAFAVYPLTGRISTQPIRHDPAGQP